MNDSSCLQTALSGGFYQLSFFSWLHISFLYLLPHSMKVRKGTPRHGISEGYVVCTRYAYIYTCMYVFICFAFTPSPLH
ncbi:hypothetical protein, unlikely [Trypanosoma brucei brucei TREU927]|uniref:Uncharacterized protein n=1 Tax=Trypanosoma brucei brucei (strain 927/4 GUTat10.1) TaxID=185431 RepID=Q38F67_TRYB2|nr:hypothetical protein, unlikely [Trypanosoma brucei brucei TREU927]EAN76553.1 hypothetical protein, unlikely [Trypanosoma brucei brucei TREU927]